MGYSRIQCSVNSHDDWLKLVDTYRGTQFGAGAVAGSLARRKPEIRLAAGGSRFESTTIV